MESFAAAGYKPESHCLSLNTLPGGIREPRNETGDETVANYSLQDGLWLESHPTRKAVGTQLLPASNVGAGSSCVFKPAKIALTQKIDNCKQV